MMRHLSAVQNRMLEIANATWTAVLKVLLRLDLKSIYGRRIQNIAGVARLLGMLQVRVVQSLAESLNVSMLASTKIYNL